MNKKKLYIIISICVFCLAALGATVAYYRLVVFNENLSTITYGLDYYINYAKGQDILGEELFPVENYVDGASSEIEFWKKDDTYDIYGHIYMDINGIGDLLSKSSALKYTLVNNGRIMSEGTLKGVSTGDSILISSNIPLKTEKQLFTIYVWLDANEAYDISLETEAMSLVVRCEATMKQIKAPVVLLDHIKNLYTIGNPTLITQSITNAKYYYSYQDSTNSWGLMNDGLKVAETQGTGSTTITDDSKLISAEEGNIRYFGEEPAVNNHIYFNCSDYSNQSDKTCERWRIIGIVDGKVKIVRDESIGTLPWDLTIIGYMNSWNQSELKNFLNGLYYNRENTNTYDYLVYARYGAEENIEQYKTLDLEEIGIKNNTRNMISESTWYLGGYSSSDVYPNEMYNYERGNLTNDYNPNSISNNIGLMYPSDYGYSADLTSCDATLKNYDINILPSPCVQTNWLGHADDEWYITPSPDNSRGVFYRNYNQHVMIGDAQYSNMIRPTLYLNTDVIINKGDGSSDMPYQIYVPTLIEHITSLYTSGNPTLITQATTNDEYYYSYQNSSKTWGLMNDGLKVSRLNVGTTVTDKNKLINGEEGNIRYFGPSESVNNYIYFNCSDYNNQSADSCELWRIIGIVDGKIKIIREELIENLAWDQDKNQDLSLLTDSNNWETSSLQILLNGLYYDRGTTTTHTYFSGSDGSTVTELDLTEIGITEATRNNNIISESKWYPGGYSTSEGVYPDDIYLYERTNTIGTTIYKGNPFYINRNIGLISASDYGFGTNLTKCSLDLKSYSNNTNSYACRNNNWLFNKENQWFLNTNPAHKQGAWVVGSYANVSHSYSVFSGQSVHPALYMNPKIIVSKSGTGTIENPYKIIIN